MIESMINPKKVEKGLWRMFFIGLLYASLSLILVWWFFSNDSVLSQYSGMIVVTFCVMFSLPFIYFIIRRESSENEEVFGLLGVWNAHKDAIEAFMWLFLGFIVAFSFWYILLGEASLFNAQIETYCNINSPGNVAECVNKYDFSTTGLSGGATGAVTKNLRLVSIIQNNVYVMIFTLIFSLIFGAGAIFILAWNASVISAAIAIFTQNSIKDIPLGILRYMIHGIPEIGAYFIAALAGGIFGFGILRNKEKGKKLLHILENVVIMVFAALVLIIVAALIEVYITPLFFK